VLRDRDSGRKLGTFHSFILTDSLDLPLHIDYFHWKRAAGLLDSARQFSGRVAQPRPEGIETSSPQGFGALREPMAAITSNR
jgi:hypothetical protein